MGSKARNVLLGIAGGMQGYQQAAKMERDQETQKLKEKFMQLQIEEQKDKLIDSGLKREKQAKLRRALREKIASGQQVQFEDIAEFADVDDTMKFLMEMSKEKQKATAEASKLQGFAPGSLVTQGGQPLFQVPDRSKILSPEEEEQKVRIGQATRRPRLLTPEEEAQQTRIAGAKAAAVQAEKPIEGQAQTALSNIREFEEIINNVEKNFDANFLGPLRNLPLVPGTRRRIGMISPKESEFQRAIKDLGDLKLRIRSGAQTAEPEFRRLVSTLPEPSDVDPMVFLSALKRVKESIAAQKAERIKLSTTPRKELKQESPKQGRLVPRPPQ